MAACLNIYLVLTVLAIGPIAKADLKELQKYSTKDFLINTAPTGCMPKGMKLDPKGNHLYLAEMCGKVDPVSKQRVPTASIYDMKTRRLHKTLVTPVGMRKGIFANTEVEFSLDGKWAFIARAEGDSQSEVYQNSGLLTVVNTAKQKISKYIPTKGQGSKIIAARPLVKEDLNQKKILYVANYFSDDLSIIDITKIKDDGQLDGTDHFVGRLRLHTNFQNPHSSKYLIAPRGIAFTRDGKYGFILSTEAGSLIVVDAVNHKQLAELAPLSDAIAGRPVNLRHIVISKDGSMAYLSHMRGNAVSRISVLKLIQALQKLPILGPQATLSADLWEELLIPFVSSSGKKKILTLEEYPKDHPNFPNQKWELAHPNTIVLDPTQGRYLYVSHRTTTEKGDRRVDSRIKGKIDIIDTLNGAVIFSLIGGAQPTALEVSHDGLILISGALIDAKLSFFNLEKLISIYEAHGK